LHHPASPLLLFQKIGVISLQKLDLVVGCIGQHDFLSVDLLNLIDGDYLIVVFGVGRVWRVLWCSFASGLIILGFGVE
jgi:hypothetical protein